MKSTATGLVCSLAILLLAPSLSLCSAVLAPDHRAPQKRGIGTSRPSDGLPLLERTVTVFTEELRADPIQNPTTNQVIYPAHSWIVFGPTERDGHLKIELVCPQVEGKSQGMAVAVTDYSRLVATEQARLAMPPERQFDERRRRALSMNVTWSNQALFSTQSAETTRHIMGDLIEGMWVKNSAAVNQYRPGEGTWNFEDWKFDDSHEFVQRVLQRVEGMVRAQEPVSDIPQEVKLVPSPEFNSIYNDLLRSRREWVLARRKLNRPQDPITYQAIDHLFYEIFTGETNPNQSPRMARELFEVRRTPNAIPSWNSQRVKDKTKVAAPVLSRDAKLTGDVLPLDQRGTLDAALSMELHGGVVIGPPAA